MDLIHLGMRIRQAIIESIEVKQKLSEDHEVIRIVGEIVETCVTAFKQGHKVLFCGNGGSAADAQHLAAELSGKFYFDRDPLPAEALHVNSSFLTAVANDYSYEEVFARLIKGIGAKGDVLVALSTSGNSRNVVRAMETARMKEMVTIAMTGAGGGKMKPLADYIIEVPSTDTPRIQESHILLGHIICELIESRLFSK